MLKKNPKPPEWTRTHWSTDPAMFMVWLQAQKAKAQKVTGKKDPTVAEYVAWLQAKEK